MVTKTGSTYTATSTADKPSIACTVPDDATACIVLVAGGSDAGAQDFTYIEWDDATPDTLAFTKIISARSTYPYDVFAYIMTSTAAGWPGSGSHTLYCDFSRTVNLGVGIAVFFVKGVNTSSPIRSTHTDTTCDPYTSALTSVVAGDLSVALGAEEETETLTETGNSQSSIYSGNYNGCEYVAAYKQGEDAMIIESTNASYNAFLAFALKVA